MVNVQGCAKLRSEDNRTAAVCYRCGEEGHFARGCSKRSEVFLLSESDFHSCNMFVISLYYIYKY